MEQFYEEQTLLCALGFCFTLKINNLAETTSALLKTKTEPAKESGKCIYERLVRRGGNTRIRASNYFALLNCLIISLKFKHKPEFCLNASFLGGHRNQHQLPRKHSKQCNLLRWTMWMIDDIWFITASTLKAEKARHCLGNTGGINSPSDNFKHIESTFGTCDCFSHGQLHKVSR